MACAKAPPGLQIGYLSPAARPDSPRPGPQLGETFLLRSARQLAQTLHRIDGRGYKAYRDLEGQYTVEAGAPGAKAEAEAGHREIPNGLPEPTFLLAIDRVQADPFAAPSKLRVRIPSETMAMPASLLGSRVRETAAAAAFARRFRDAIQREKPPRRGTGKSGLIHIDAGGQEILERTAFRFGPGFAEARIEVGLPAQGRRVSGAAAETLLLGTLPRIARDALLNRSESDDAELLRFVDCAENQESIREQLADRSLVAFVGNGSILPRESGASDRPMDREKARPFESPEAFLTEFEVPNADAGARGRIWRGMGIPRGVVLLVGGGYHGKSTLLRAVERAVVAHIPGDGRETVVSAPDLVKIRAEDGRSVRGASLEGFIRDLPAAGPHSKPRDTSCFSTEEASGSTSQAANIIEAIEAGASGFLLDEDTSATNFMVRDARMQALVHPRNEPIIPFCERVRELWEAHGLSTLLVMGGSGEFFGVADAVIEMKAYAPIDVTERAHALANLGTTPNMPAPERALFTRPRPRTLDPASLDARRGRREIKFSSRGCDEIVFGTTEIDLRGLEQLLDPSQTRAIAAAIHAAQQRFMDTAPALPELLDDLEAFFDREGLDALDPYRQPGDDSHPGAFARPRRFEIAAALSRMRSLRLR